MGFSPQWQHHATWTKHLPRRSVLDGLATCSASTSSAKLLRFAFFAVVEMTRPRTSNLGWRSLLEQLAVFSRKWHAWHGSNPSHATIELQEPRHNPGWVGRSSLQSSERCLQTGHVDSSTMLNDPSAYPQSNLPRFEPPCPQKHPPSCSSRSVRSQGD